MSEPSWVPSLRAYYRSPAIRARIAEYCGGLCDQPHTFSCWRLAAYGGERRLAEADGGPIPVPKAELVIPGFLFDPVARFGERLVHVQVSDNRGISDDHLPPGQGHIDWNRFLRALVEVRYRGVFMLEVSGNGDIGAHVRLAAEAVRRVLTAT